MFGESRMGCRHDAKAHLAPPNRLLQRCNGHFDLRIVCCNDVTVISTSESFAALMQRSFRPPNGIEHEKTTLWDIPKVNFKYISKQ